MGNSRVAPSWTTEVNARVVLAPPSSSCCSSRRVRALTVCGGWRVSCGRASRDRRSPCTSTQTTSDASQSVAAASRRATDDWAFPRTSDTLRQRPTAHTHTHTCTSFPDVAGGCCVVQVGVVCPITNYITSVTTIWGSKQTVACPITEQVTFLFLTSDCQHADFTFVNYRSDSLPISQQFTCGAGGKPQYKCHFTNDLDRRESTRDLRRLH